MFKKEHIPWNKGLKGYRAGIRRLPLGYKCSEETKEKMSEAHSKGDKAANWKGDSVSYSTLHSWVRKGLGKPTECVHCGRTDKRISWASISHKAKRDLDDYIPLCMSCHKTYDNQNVCKNGHELTEENVYRYKNRRWCKTCYKIYQNNYKLNLTRGGASLS